MLEISWFIIALGTAFVLGALGIVTSVILSPNNPHINKATTFDCGEAPSSGRARTSFNFQYYPLMIVFAAFDAAAAFIVFLAVTSLNIHTIIFGSIFIGSLIAIIPFIIQTIESIFIDVGLTQIALSKKIRS